MRELYLGKIFDFIFFGSFVFLITFIWSRYFVRNFWIAIVISILLTITFMTVANLLSKKKRERQKKEQHEKSEANAISTNFLLKSKQEILKIFFEKLNIKYSVKIKSDFLIVNNNVLRPIYTTQKIIDKDILESYKKAKLSNAKKLIITCKDIDNSAESFTKLISDIEIILLSEYDAYKNIFKPLNFDVPQIQEAKKEKKKFSQYLEFAFNKSRTKNYFLVSVFMLFSSFILRYNIYYLIFATLTGILGLYSHFNTKFNKKSQNLL